ncbi:9953_t:CDS:2, partial [Dentiscutata heterogama]
SIQKIKTIMIKPTMLKVNYSFEFLEEFQDATKSTAKHLLEQNLKVNCCKLFNNDDDYKKFKKDVEALHFATSEEEILQFLNTIKKVAEKACSSEKIESYLQTWMKDSKMWIYTYTKQYYHMEISTTGQSKSSYNAIHLQCLKAVVNTGSNKVAVNPFILHNPRFSELIENISVWEINKIKQTLQQYKEPIAYKSDEIFECTIKIYYKLPCIYIIPKHGAIPLSIIDNRWLLERPNIIELLYLSKSAIVNSEFYNTFELLLSEHQDAAAAKKKKILNNIRKSKNITIQQQNIPLRQIFKPSDYKLYEANIYQFMREHVLEYLIVVKDRNCEFCAITKSIGKPKK